MTAKQHEGGRSSKHGCHLPFLNPGPALRDIFAMQAAGWRWIRATALVLFLWLPIADAAAQGASPVAPPPAPVLAEAKALVAAMKESERGPYSGIRWFCRDGTVLPPQSGTCRDHGGGRQHGAYSAQRERLAQLGWHAGTVYAALSWEELWDSGPRHQRLRELPLEHFLVEVDDGWVLRRARYYRGRVQVEDEEAAGRELLMKLLAQRRTWLDSNYLLVRELVRTIPHDRGDDRTREVRALAQQIADRAPAFQPLRLEVHSRPTQHTAARIRAWIGEQEKLAPELAADAGRLADALDELYGDAARAARLAKAESALSQTVPPAARSISRARGASGTQRISALVEAMRHLRQHVPTEDPRLNLYRLGVMNALEAELRVAAMIHLADAPRQRRELLSLAADLLEASHAAGLLSVGETDSLVRPLRKLLEGSAPDGQAYAFAVRRLSLAAGWAAMSVKHAFAEPLVRYQALEPQAARFVDELLRASVLLPLGEVADRLGADSAVVSGQPHHILNTAASDVLGLNPGVATGRLRVLEPADLAAGKQPRTDEIAVLSGAVAELLPPAGIITLGEGNPLSHVQMLARNLAIPNAAVSPEVFRRLRGAEGQAVILVVSARGQVYLEKEADAPRFLARPGAGTQAASSEKVSAPRPDLDVTEPLPLARLHAGLSGRVVGPKAANVGELARLFPGRVAPAVAIPFGVFAQYTEDQRRQVEEGYEMFRSGSMSQAELDELLERLQREIRSVTLGNDYRSRLLQAMESEFGNDPGAGLFVRSDTNVEDLPGFTGAGLNKTLPNVVGRDAQLAGVPEVWASVYSPRSMRWRSTILNDPHRVYASVLLMKSIPADKSGVLVTTDLASGDPGLTVSTAWGVGGAVDNESAASLVLRPDGTRLLLAEAKAPYHRELDPSGGLKWLPAPAGPVLTSSEKDALRKLAAEVAARYPVHRDDEGRALPWDIEFAFAGDRLWLLQIRPLVQRGQAAAEAAIARLLPPAAPRQRVDLDAMVPSGGPGTKP